MPQFLVVFEDLLGDEVDISNFTCLVKFDMEKFDRRINFGLCQVQVKDVQVQARLCKALKNRLGSGASKESSDNSGPKESNRSSIKSSISDED